MFLKPFHSYSILIIDDEEMIRDTLSEYLLEQGFSIQQAGNGAEGLEKIESSGPDLILCDLMMPVKNGLEVLEHLKKAGSELPVIIISGTDEISVVIEALKLGAWDYVTKPIYDMTVILHSVTKALERAMLIRENSRYQHHLEQMVQKRTVELQNEIEMRKKAEKKIEEQLKQLEKAFQGTAQAIVAAVEMRDPYTAGHQRRVADIAGAIARAMGLPEDAIKGIEVSGAIHDLGKLSVPSELLSKPTRLTEVEMKLVQSHSQSGYELLKNIDFPWPVADIVHQHHERIDGSGYPRGLSGKDVRIEARIIAVADVVEAMASHRPYREALGIEKAIEEISDNKGTKYDTGVVDSCITLITENGLLS